MRLLPSLLVAVLAVASAVSVSAQQDRTMHVHGPQCELPAAPFEGFVRVAPSARAQAHLAGLAAGRAASTITVNFLSSGTVFGQTCTAWPASAQAAMNYAADLWEAELDSTEPMTMDACWSSSLGGTTLGSAGAVTYQRDFAGAPLADTWYPIALANALAGADLNPGTAEMQAAFAAARTDWYFGTDMNVPFNRIDFVTVALHELGHALGFAGFGSVPRQSVRQLGTPTIYDRLVEDGAGTPITDTATYPDPSATMVSALTGGDAAPLYTRDGPSIRRIYTPTSWIQGSSYSHFDFSETNELMRASVSFGLAIHNPDETLNLFRAIGWSGPEPDPSASLTGVEGWRMLTSPAPVLVGTLLDPIRTIGFPGADETDGTPSVYTYSESAVGGLEAGYQAADGADPVTPGTGLFVYVFEDDDPDVGGVQGGFPKRLRVSGSGATAPFAFPLGYTDTADPADEDGWNLVGNPFDAGLDLDVLTRTDVSTASYVYSAADGQYLSRTVGVGDLDGVLSSFQGFWVQALAASPAMSAGANAVVGNGPLVQRASAAPSLALHLTDAEGTTDTAHLAFLAGADAGLDRFDAYELDGLGADRARLFAVVDGEAEALGLDVSVVPAEGARVDLGVAATPGAALVLTWPELDVEAGWPLTLLDTATGAEIDLRTATEYAFTATATDTAQRHAATGPPAPRALRLGAEGTARAADARFRLHAGLATTDGAGGTASGALVLGAALPNPSRGTAAVPFELAEAGPLRLSVFDALGREVAVLASGEHAAGTHRAELDAASLAPGVYVVRLVAGDAALTRRVTVVR